MKDLLPDIERWRARGERFVIATVVATRRSAPRPVGSKLAVSESGELAGSVSGGCVENEVYGSARELLAGAPPQLLSYGISDDLALSVGLPCGGEIDVFVQEPDPALLEELLPLVASEEHAVVLTDLETGEQRLLRDGAELDAEKRVAAPRQRDARLARARADLEDPAAWGNTRQLHEVLEERLGIRRTGLVVALCDRLERRAKLLAVRVLLHQLH